MSTDQWLAISLTIAVIIVFLLMYGIYELWNALIWAKDDLLEKTDHEHAKCMAAIMAFVGDEFAAQILEAAAEDYRSPAGQHDIDRIKNLKWHADGPPVPTIWLQERADRIRVMIADAREETAEEVRTLDGSLVR